MGIIDKQLICERFRRAQQTYRREASVQHHMARELISRLPGTYFGRILEIGPGCGLLTDQIEEQLEFGELELVDLDASCEEFHRKRRNSKFLAGDIERIELSGKYDLIAANAALQWVADRRGVYEKLAGLLNDSGVIALGIFGPENLYELRELTGNSLDYLSKTEFLCRTAPYLVWDEVREWKESLNFPTPVDVLRHLKATGVNALPSETGNSGKLWTKSRLEHFEHDYRERFSNPGSGCHLTYHPIVAIGRKKKI